LVSQQCNGRKVKYVILVLTLPSVPWRLFFVNRKLTGKLGVYMYKKLTYKHMNSTRENFTASPVLKYSSTNKSHTPITSKTLIYSPFTPTMYHYYKNADLCCIASNFDILSEQEAKLFALCLTCHPAKIQIGFVEAATLPTPTQVHLYNDMATCNVKTYSPFSVAKAQSMEIDICESCLERYLKEKGKK